MRIQVSRVFRYNSALLRLCLVAALICVAASGASGQASRLPLVRFGDSEFRLATKNSIERQFRFSPDGKRVAGANWYEFRVWSFPDGQLIHDFSGIISSGCIGFGSGGKVLLALYERTKGVYRFDVETGKLIGRTKLADVVDEQGATYHFFSDDGSRLLTTEEYGHVCVWDTSSGKRLFRKQIFRPYGSRISNDGVLSLWDGSFFDRYDVRTDEQLIRKRATDWLRIIAGNAQGTLVAGYSAKDKAIVFWDLVKDVAVGGKIPVAEEQSKDLHNAALSADGRRFVFWKNDGKSIWEHKIAVYDVESGQLVSAFDPPGANFIDQPIVSPDGRYMFPAGGRSVFTPVDTSSGKLLRELPDHVLGIERLAFTPNASTLLVGSRDKRQAWHVESGRPGAVLEASHSAPNVVAVDNRHALVSQVKGGGVRLQNIETGDVVRHFEKEGSTPLEVLQLSADRKSFVGMVREPQGQSVRRWEIATGKVLAEHEFPPPKGMGGRLDGRINPFLVLGGSRLIQLQQVVPPKIRDDGSIDWGKMELRLLNWKTQSITSRLPIPAMGRIKYADNGDGTTLAIVVNDLQNPPGYGEPWYSTHLVIWDTATGWERLHVKREMHSYFDSFSLVAVARGGRIAATVSQKNRIDVWNGFNGYRLDSFDAGSDVTAVAFSSDGGMLATGHDDGVVNVWSTREEWDQAVPARHTSATAVQQYWKDLGAEGRQLATAMQVLLANPEHAVEMLQQNLQPAAPAAGVAGFLENAAALQLADADNSSDFLQTDPPAIRLLREALRASSSEEDTARINGLLEAAANPMSPESRRPILGVLLAEQIDTSESWRLVERMAGGHATALETQVAKAALARRAAASADVGENAVKE